MQLSKVSKRIGLFLGEEYNVCSIVVVPPPPPPPLYVLRFIQFMWDKEEKGTTHRSAVTGKRIKMKVKKSSKDKEVYIYFPHLYKPCVAGLLSSCCWSGLFSPCSHSGLYCYIIFLSGSSTENSSWSS